MALIARFARWGLVCLLIAWPQGAHSQTLAALDRALAEAQWDEASAIARSLDTAAGHGDIFAAYAAAVRHAETGQCGNAVILADLVSNALPFFAPPYLIGYRCHLALGDHDAAARALGTLVAILPEGPERAIVEQTLRNVQSQDRPAFSGYFSVAPSSNVNRQTSATTITGGNLGTGTIPDDARGQSGALFSAGGDVTLQLARTDRLAVSGVLRTDIRYSTADERFEPSFTAEAPIAFQPTPEMHAILAPYATIGFSDTTHVRTEGGIRTSLGLSLSAIQRLAVNARAARVERPANPDRSGMVLDGAVSLGNAVTPNLNITGTLRARYNRTDRPDLSTLETTASVRADMLFEGGLLLGLQGTLGQRNHWRPAPFVIGANQVDRFLTGRIELSHRDIAIGPFMPSIHYEQTSAWSDNVFYTYQSQDIGLSLRARF